MAFRDFTFTDAQTRLGLTVSEASLYGSVPPLAVRPEFLRTLQDGVDLALAVSTEKARSEFIIAPLLLELRRMLNYQFGLFSGVELDVDPDRGLNGVCDFLITRSPQQIQLSAPLVAIVEAKNDNVRTGYGQCIAALVAAQALNQQAGVRDAAVHGVVTTGSAWRFLRLEGSEVTFDMHEYFITEPGRIMGILAAQIGAGPPDLAAPAGASKT